MDFSMRATHLKHVEYLFLLAHIIQVRLYTHVPKIIIDAAVH